MAFKLAVIGSGSWGTTMANIAAKNLLNMTNQFDSSVKMWIFDEVVNGQKLSHIINTQQENVRYLPGVKLSPNLVACTSLENVVSDATHLIFVVPHQFLEKTLDSMVGKVRSDAVSISLIKGLMENESGLQLISELIKKKIGTDVSVLSGANIASEIAIEKFSEATIASIDFDLGNLWKKVFQTKYFKINIVKNFVAVEIFGALKNGVAIAAGFSEALEQGSNTKAAIIRIGMKEIIKFARLFTKIEDESIFLESFGVADLIATCFAGRNRLVAEAHIRTKKPFDILEKELLAGQKLQGPDTIKNACNIIVNKNMQKEFPLFMSINEILFEGKDPSTLISLLMEYM